jgi:hypothetical protein
MLILSTLKFYYFRLLKDLKNYSEINENNYYD